VSGKVIRDECSLQSQRDHRRRRNCNKSPGGGDAASDLDHCTAADRDHHEERRLAPEVETIQATRLKSMWLFGM